MSLRRMAIYRGYLENPVAYVISFIRHYLIPAIQEAWQEYRDDARYEMSAPMDRAALNDLFSQNLEASRLAVEAMKTYPSWTKSP